MSIASQITAYANGLTDAYDMVARRGGTMPTRKNMENLDAAIATIPSGGATEDYGTLRVAVNYSGTVSVNSVSSGCTVTITNQQDAYDFLHEIDNVNGSNSDFYYYPAQGWQASMTGVYYSTQEFIDNGIDITLETGVTSANIILSVGLNVDTTTSRNINVTNILDFYSLSFINIGEGADYRSFTIDGTKYSREIILGYTFGNNVANPGSYFLAYCYNLQDNVTVPSSVTKVGDYFLGYCNNYTGSVAFSGTGYEVGRYFMSNCSQFNSSIDLSGAAKIGDYAFTQCTSLNSAVSLGGDVGHNMLRNLTTFNAAIDLTNANTIGDYFLAGDTSFDQSLDLSNITRIGMGFLNNCASFSRTLTLPSTLSMPNANNFLYNCNGVTALVVNCPVPTTMNTSTLATTTESAAIYATGVTITGTTAQDWISGISNSAESPFRNIIGAAYAYFVYSGSRVNLGSSIPSFLYNSSSTSPYNFTYKNTTYDISRVTEINLGAMKNVTQISNNFMRSWSNGNHMKVVFPPNVTYVGSYCCYMANVVNVVENAFPKTTSIGSYCFYGNHSINSPLDFSSLKSLGPGLLHSASGFNQPLNFPELTSVSNTTGITSGSFMCEMAVFNSPVSFPKLTSYAGQAFRKLPKFNQDVIIPSTLTTTPSQWFYNCDNMTSTITILCSGVSSGNLMFATDSSTAACYLQGIKLAGPNAALWHSNNADKSSSGAGGYRKTIVVS